MDLNKRLKLNWNLFSTTYIPIQFGSLNALYLIANEPALYLECAFRCRRFRHINKLVDSPPKILISIQWIHQGYIQGRQTEWKLTSATSRLFDYEIKKKRDFRDFWYFETKKVTSAMARWHWLEWRPWKSFLRIKTSIRIFFKFYLPIRLVCITFSICPLECCKNGRQ